MMIKIILIIAVVTIINSPFQPGDFSTGSPADCNDLFTKNQSGFMAGDPYIFWLLSILHEINSYLDCNPTMHVTNVFQDICKTFDKVWHERLLFNLELYGIRGELLKLFKDYLPERHQRVVLNGQSSSLKVIKSGVPIASFFGLLLLLIYTNDSSGGLSSRCKIFADDTSLIPLAMTIKFHAIN